MTKHISRHKENEQSLCAKIDKPLLLYDFAYTKNKIGCNYISRELADELLRQMCVMSGELGAARAAIMHRALRIVGGAAYEEPNIGEYKGAENLMNFMWTAK
jgi:hypothetical protein